MRSVGRLGTRVWLLAGAATSLLATSALAETASTGAATLDDLVVTATKRPQAVREIPASVSAFDEQALATVGADQMADYLTRTPGVQFNQSAPGNSSAILRGVATTTGIAQAQGTTGYFIDDVPLTDPFYSTGIPDVDTFDVDNITVLRGPQGTLFGSASLGGAINYQAKRPNLTQYDAHVRGTYDTVDHGEDGYGVAGMVNLPLVSDRFAVRAVVTTRRDAGYVDNLGTGQSDANRTIVRGGRVLATFAPTDSTRINYLYLQQTASTDDLGATDPKIGPYAKSTKVAEPFSYSTRIHNLRLDQDLGFATFTATATRHEKTFSTVQDYSALVAPLAPVSFLESGSSKGDTLEARIASNPGGRLDYLAGIFYDSTDELVRDQLIAPAAQAAFGSSSLIDAPVKIQGREAALFGEATYHLTDTLKATLGGRLFRTKLSTDTVQDGPLAGGHSETFGGSRETGFSPKASLSWQPSPDQMVYALISKGFRFGGPNISIDPKFAIPPEFKSDSLINYELGARTNWFERRLQVDATLFYVDWDNIQVTQTSPSGFTYTDNAGKARNMGVEASATWRVTRDFTLTAAATGLDAELMRDYHSGRIFVSSGTQLPGASHWQVSDTATWVLRDVPLQPTFVLSHRYVSTAPGELKPNPQRQGGYNVVDLRVSGSLDHVELTAFVDNLGDARGVSTASTSVHGPVQFLIRPRTVGVTLDYHL